MGKLREFNAYLEEQEKNGSIYVWGAQGQQATEALIDQREKESGNRKKAKALLEKRRKAGYDMKKVLAFDCSGLGMCFLQNRAGLSKTDMTANGMLGKCKKIAKEELQKGDWVFRVYKTGSKKGRAYHIGYVVDDGLHVIEARGRAYGVQTRTLNASGASYWNAFGRPEYFAEDIAAEKAEPDKTDAVAISRNLKLTSPYMRGEDVKWLQKALNHAGCSCGSTDGIFGKNTQKAVKAYQKAKGLKVDGIAGKNTVKALGGVWK